MFQKLLGGAAMLQHFHKLPQPAKRVDIGLIPRLLIGLLVKPMSRDAELCHFMHHTCADLNFNAFLLRTDNSRVDGAIAIVLRR